MLDSVAYLPLRGSQQVANRNLDEARVAPVLLLEIPAEGRLLASLAVWTVRRPEVVPAGLVRFTLPPRDAAPLTFIGGLRDLAILSDGTQVVYTGQPNGSTTQLEVRPIDQLESAPLRGGENSLGPFVSTDGEWVGFVDFNGTILSRASILGGSPVTLTEVPNGIFGASWGSDDQIVFGTNGAGLFRVPGGGGEPEALTTLDPDEGDGGHYWPTIIPGRRAVLFVTATGVPLSSGQLAVLDLDTGDTKRLAFAGVSPQYVRTGHLVYAAEDGSVRAVPFDAASLEVTGNPVPLVEGVSVKATGVANFAVSDDGRLVYATRVGASGAPPRSLVWVDRDGREEPLGDTWQQDQYITPRFSPDGMRVAVAVAENADTNGNPADLWVLDLTRGSCSRITFGGNNRFFPVWSPDGTQLAFSDGTGGTNRLLVASADGSGQVETLLDRDERQFPTAWAPDGSALAIYTDRSETARDIAVLPVDGDQTPVPFVATPFQERAGTFSPDGRWLAYVSDEAGQNDVYVRPCPGPGQETTVSISGGVEPVWSADGSELFYRNRDQMLAVAVDAGESFRASVPELLFEGPYALDISGGGGGVSNYDVAPDGRFLMIKRVGQGGDDASPEITVVLNWFEELNTRVPVP